MGVRSKPPRKSRMGIVSPGMCQSHLVLRDLETEIIGGLPLDGEPSMICISCQHFLG